MPKPRMAVGGFMLESNGHSPRAMREEPGPGARFRARFNSEESHPRSGRFEADAHVVAGMRPG